MKKSSLFALGVLLSCLVWILGFTPPTAQSEKYALLITVADYPKSSGWETLSSDRDGELLMESMLRAGFKKENIIHLSNEQATKENIVGAIRDIQQRAGNGDVVWIHFSGHGQQITDDNGDEIDSYDEALIPIDAQKNFQPGIYAGENHLRDDFFGQQLLPLRNRLGKKGSVLITIDACHSGTATRSSGTATYRGTGEAFDTGENTQPLGTGDKGGGMHMDLSTDNSAPMIVISGARHDQLNSEIIDPSGQAVGSLSYAIAANLNRVKSNFSYAALFELIKIDMATLAPNQDPQIEGDIHTELFSGSVVEQVPYYTVSQVADGFPIVNMGKMSGVHVGTQVHFYPIGTQNPEDAKAIAEGEVISSDELFSTIELNGNVEMEEIRKSWVFVTAQNFGDIGVNVGVFAEDRGFEKQFEKSLKERPLLRLVNEQPEVILQQKGDFVDVVTHSDAMILDGVKLEGDSALEKISGRLEKYSRAKYLRQLNYQNDLLDLELEIVPVTYKKVNGKYVVDEELDLAEYTTDGGQVEFPIGTTFILRITNYGRKRAYFNVLHIGPQDDINVYLPLGNQNAMELVLNPRQTYTFERIVQITDPIGFDIFKVVATDVPIDLRPIVQSGGTGNKRSGNPFEALFSDVLGSQTATQRSVKPSTFHTHSIAVKVVNP